MSRGHRARDIGGAWEARAVGHLERAGLTILARGYRCRLGEIDIVATDGRRLVIVEVRARRSAGHGSALESVTPSKQRRIIRATRHFLMGNPVWHSRPIRFDVLAFDGIDDAAPKTTWVRNAFTVS